MTAITYIFNYMWTGA